MHQVTGQPTFNLNLPISAVSRGGVKLEYVIFCFAREASSRVALGDDMTKKLKKSAELARRRRQLGLITHRLWFVTVFASAFSVVYCSHKEKSMESPLMNIASQRKEVPKFEEAENLPYLDPKSAFFDFDKAILRADGKKALLPTLEWMRKNPQVQLQVEGYCDERGSDAYNLKLGEKRANAVRSFLLGQGIDAERITAISYGRIEGASSSERNQNRRVGLVVIYGSESAKLGKN